MLRPTTTPTRDYRVLISGQSLAFDFADYASWQGLFYSLVANAIGANPEKKTVATNGSSILKRFNATNYWYDEDTSSNGPLLTAAEATIATEVSASRTPNAIVWVQGEQDAGPMTSLVDQGLYQSGLAYVLTALRTAINPGSPTSVPVVVSTLGRRVIVGSYPGYGLVREAQLVVVAAGTNIAAIDKYDIGLRDDIHGDDAGYQVMGERIGRALYSLSGGSPELGPQIDTANVNIVGSTVEIPILLEGAFAITKPTTPCGFRFETSAGVALVPTSYSWSTNTLIATFASPVAAGGKMKFPYETITDFATAGLISYTTNNGPSVITATLSGLPLRSILPITL